MLTFKSKAAAEFQMYSEHAKHILHLLHKDGERGVITAAETSDAIAALEAEIARTRAHQAAYKLQHDLDVLHDEDEDDDDEHEDPEEVDFSARVYPFLQMLRAAKKSGNDVVWGV